MVNFSKKLPKTAYYCLNLSICGVKFGVKFLYYKKITNKFASNFN